MRRSSRLFWVAVLVLSLVAGVTVGLPPVAVAAAPGGSPERSVPVRSLASKVQPLPQMPNHVPRPVVWPSVASAQVLLAVVAGQRAAATAMVGGLPVTVSPVPVDEVTGVLLASALTVKVDTEGRAGSGDRR